MNRHATTPEPCPEPTPSTRARGPLHVSHGRRRGGPVADTAC
jgi:hypothetical protein